MLPAPSPSTGRTAGGASPSAPAPVIGSTVSPEPASRHRSPGRPLAVAYEAWCEALGPRRILGGSRLQGARSSTGTASRHPSTPLRLRSGSGPASLRWTVCGSRCSRPQGGEGLIAGLGRRAGPPDGDSQVSLTGCRHPHSAPAVFDVIRAAREPASLGGVDRRGRAVLPRAARFASGLFPWHGEHSSDGRYLKEGLGWVWRSVRRSV